MTGGGLDLPAVAVVGLAGRFPAARDVEELWRNLIAGVESIRRLTPEEMRASGVSNPTDPLWIPAAGVLDGADLFDAPFFQITPREAELLDPQHRVFLETAWEALENAGCDPSRLSSGAGAIGVFAGAGLNTYLLNNLLPGGESITNPQVVIASDKDFLTTRLSYKLDLKGPSLDVQTGCWSRWWRWCSPARACSTISAISPWPAVSPSASRNAPVIFIKRTASCRPTGIAGRSTPRRPARCPGTAPESWCSSGWTKRSPRATRSAR